MNEKETFHEVPQAEVQPATDSSRQEREDRFRKNFHETARKYFRWLTLAAGILGSEKIAEAKEVSQTLMIETQKVLDTNEGQVRFARGRDQVTIGDINGKAVVSEIVSPRTLRGRFFTFESQGEKRDLYENEGSPRVSGQNEIAQLVLPEGILETDESLRAARTVVDGIGVDLEIINSLKQAEEIGGPELPVAFRDLEGLVDKAKALHPYVDVDFKNMAAVVGLAGEWR